MQILRSQASFSLSLSVLPLPGLRPVPYLPFFNRFLPTEGDAEFFEDHNLQLICGPVCPPSLPPPPPAWP